MAVIKGDSLQDKFRVLHKKATDKGTSYHDQIVMTANLLRDHGVHPETAIELMYKASEKVTRREPRRGEIEKVVRWSYSSSNLGASTVRQKPISKKKNQAIIDAWASKGSVQALMKSSGPIPQTGEEILDKFYDDDDLLHLAKDVYSSEIKTKREWVEGGLQDIQYFCPCVFKEPTGGRVASNVKSRPIVVFETDDLPRAWDKQCGLISRLAEELELLLCLTTSSKSIHAHFKFSNNEAQMDKFYGLAIQMGGDEAVLRPAQLVRFPWGTNKATGNLQKVFYFHG